MSRRTDIVAATLAVAFLAPAGAAAQPAPGTLADLRLEEALLAMSHGEHERALDLALLVVKAAPDDPRGHREAGRCAHALGRFQIAIDHLERALALEHQDDPEIHYLLGEALYASGRAAEAIRQHDQVRREIAPDTSGWMELLWLARIHARRGELRQADAIYRALQVRDPASVEVQIARIEAYTLARRWGDAERLLRELIARHRDHPRARDMLAWVLEAEGRIDEERALRADLARDPERAGARRLADHARALERSGEYGAALARYRDALDAADGTAELDEVEIRAAVSRLTHRLTPEVMAGAATFSDPSGSLHRVRTGVAVPAYDYLTLSLLASMEWAGSGAVPGAMPRDGVRVGTLDAVAAGAPGEVVSGIITVSGSYFAFDDAEGSARLGSGFDVRLGQGKPLQLHTLAALNMPWRETASTMREGGRETGVTSVVYALPFGSRVIFDAGVRRRAMKLEPIMDLEATAAQTTLVAGADWVVWAPPTTVLGHFLDDDLQWASGAGDALTVSYRHYEAFTEDDLGARLDLAERGSVDEVSAVARNTRPDGVFGFEVRGGGGRDWARDARLLRAGVTLTATPSESVRLSASFDHAQESTSGFSGTRNTAWGSVHVDL